MSYMQPPHPVKQCHSECSRRDFMRATALGTTALGTTALGTTAWIPGSAVAVDDNPVSSPETTVKLLYDSLSEKQRATICFPWDHMDAERGLLRTRISNNWQVTDPEMSSGFYTDDQRAMIRQIFEGIVQPLQKDQQQECASGKLEGLELMAKKRKFS